MSGRASNNIPPSIRKIWEHDQRALERKYLSTSTTSSNTTTESSTMAVPASSRAIVCRDTLQNGGWKMEDVSLRPLQKGELLVEMVATGVCHTDVLIGSIPAGVSEIGFYPRVVGHEGSGYVREVGPGVTVAKPGDAVLCSYTYCGECTLCKNRDFSHCNNFNEINFGPSPYAAFNSPPDSSPPNIDGTFFGQSSFAHYTIVQSQSVVNVTSIVTSKRELQLFAPLGCGIQTGSGTVMNVSGAGETDSLCIIGLGGVGLAAVMSAKIKNCRQIIGIDRIASRLALAQEFGCTHIINGDDLPAGKTIGDVVRDIADGVGPTITIDTTGAPALIEAGVEFTRNRGKYVQVGSPPLDYVHSKLNAFAFMVSGKQLVGAIEGAAFAPEYVPKMIGWYREGKFPIDKLMKFIPAEEFKSATEEMHTGETIKPILTWS